MEKFQQKYRIPSARLKGYDYGSNGLYYVTICTQQRIHYFGEIVETRDCASERDYASDDRTVETRDCASLYDCASNSDKETGNRPSLPNQAETHNRASLHSTQMGSIAHQYWNEIPHHYPFVELDEFVVMPNHMHGILFFNKPDKIDWNENKFGVQSMNLAAVVRGFKSSVKRYSNLNNLEFAWQSRFHDTIIKNEGALKNIREYIVNNPINWHLDELNVQNLLNITVETRNCASNFHNIAETHNRASLPQTNI